MSTVLESQKVLNKVKSSVSSFTGSKEMIEQLFLLSIIPDKSDYELSVAETIPIDTTQFADVLARDFVFRNRRVEAFYHIRQFKEQLLISMVTNDADEANKTIVFNIIKEKGVIKEFKYSKTTNNSGEFLSNINSTYFSLIDKYYKEVKELQSGKL